MNKMTKIAMVGLLATQGHGCYRAHELSLLNPEERAKQLEKDLKEYHVISSSPGIPAGSLGLGMVEDGLAYIDIQKGNRKDSISMLDLDLDGQVDLIYPSLNNEFDVDNPTSHRVFKIEEFAPKVREVFQKAYSKHQAGQRNYKK